MPIVSASLYSVGPAPRRYSIKRDFTLEPWRSRHSTVSGCRQFAATLAEMDSVMEVKGHTGTIRFDGRMITILRTGFLARASVGKGEKQIPLAHVTAIQFKPAGPLVNGFIQFTVSGGNERRSRFGQQTTDAARDENSVVFHYKQREQFVALREAVQLAMAATQSTPQPRAQDHDADDIPQKIKKLAELHAAGVLTDDEFAAKKADLLERM